MPKRKSSLSHEEVLTTSQVIEAGWEDFRDFTNTDIMDKLPKGRRPGKKFQENLRRLLEEYPDETKAIFGAGFLGSMHMLAQATAAAMGDDVLEHLGEHHQSDPRIPRA